MLRVDEGNTEFAQVCDVFKDISDERLQSLFVVG